MGYLAILIKTEGASRDASRHRRFAFIALTIAFLFLFIACQLVLESRMGLALEGVALIVGYFAFFADFKEGRQSGRMTWVFLGAGVALFIFFVVFGLSGLVERFDQGSEDGGRVGFALTTLKAALAFLPFGAGLGAFPEVYGVFETRELLMPGLYANHAHNDFAELFLETGVFGLAWAGAFIFWWGRQIRRNWGPHPESVGPVELILSRSGVIVVGLLLLHSLVDYPLRTQTLAVVMAMACALMLKPFAANVWWAAPAHRGGAARKSELKRSSNALRGISSRRARGPGAQ
ncbi:MAG: O-antigen ligase family protein [Beijerinckiaceae bacterium]|jgi:hypothetical protein